MVRTLAIDMIYCNWNSPLTPNPKRLCLTWLIWTVWEVHCVKSVLIWSYSVRMQENTEEKENVLKTFPNTIKMKISMKLLILPIKEKEKMGGRIRDKRLQRFWRWHNCVSTAWHLKILHNISHNHSLQWFELHHFIHIIWSYLEFLEFL